MYIIFLLLILGYFTVLSFFEARDIKKLKEMVITEKIRTKNYREGIILGWIPALVVLLICLFSSISFNDIGLRQLGLNYNIWFNVITLIISGGYLALMLYQMISYMASVKYREKAKEQLENASQKNNYNAIMNNIALPRSKKEKRLFFGLSLTAGISEEIVFRGFMFFILKAIFPDLSLIIVVIIISIIFGILHIYQGFSGIIKTALFGAFFGCLYLVTNSIFPGIILHFIGDFSSAFLLSDE